MCSLSLSLFFWESQSVSSRLIDMGHKHSHHEKKNKKDERNNNREYRSAVLLDDGSFSSQELACEFIILLIFIINSYIIDSISWKTPFIFGNFSKWYVGSICFEKFYRFSNSWNSFLFLIKKNTHKVIEQFFLTNYFYLPRVLARTKLFNYRSRG